tara:strand:+ start:529 stop:717 length:189 start_codon:yes stop_codon:yes gene_type:complete
MLQSTENTQRQFQKMTEYAFLTWQARQFQKFMDRYPEEYKPQAQELFIKYLAPKFREHFESK